MNHIYTFQVITMLLDMISIYYCRRISRYRYSRINISYCHPPVIDGNKKPNQSLMVIFTFTEDGGMTKTTLVHNSSTWPLSDVPQELITPMTLPASLGLTLRCIHEAARHGTEALRQRRSVLKNRWGKRRMMVKNVVNHGWRWLKMVNTG